jgi:hypothetical protein
MEKRQNGFANQTFILRILRISDANFVVGDADDRISVTDDPKTFSELYSGVDPGGRIRIRRERTCKKMGSFQFRISFKNFFFLEFVFGERKTIFCRIFVILFSHSFFFNHSLTHPFIHSFIHLVSQ